MSRAELKKLFFLFFASRRFFSEKNKKPACFPEKRGYYLNRPKRGGQGNPRIKQGGIYEPQSHSVGGYGRSRRHHHRMQLLSRN